MINYGEADSVDIPGVPDDTKWLGDRIAAVNASVRDLAKAIAAGDPTEAVYWAMPLHNDFPQSVRVKLKWLVLSVSAACTVAIKIGTATFASFDFVGADTQVLPFPVDIQPGVDVTITASAGTLRAGYFTGSAGA